MVSLLLHDYAYRCETGTVLKEIETGDAAKAQQIYEKRFGDFKKW